MNKKCIADRSVVSTLRRCFLTTVSSVLLLTSCSVTAWLGDQFEYVPAGKESVIFEPMDGDGVRLALTHDKGEKFDGCSIFDLLYDKCWNNWVTSMFIFDILY